MGVPTADADCLCMSFHPALLKTDVETFPYILSALSLPISPPKNVPAVTFDNVAVDRGSEVLPGLLVEVLAVDDPHLFEESRLAALAGAEQQDLHQPLHVRFLPRQTSVDLLGPAELLDLAVVQQADGQTNF